LPWDIFLAQSLCGETQPDFLFGLSISMPLAILMIPVSLKGWELKQGIHHQLFVSNLKKIHFLPKLCILGVAFIGAFKSST
jgi:hypothetical protein